MSTSDLPPPPSSLRSFLRRSAELSRFISAMLVTALAIQFSFISVRRTLALGDKPSLTRAPRKRRVTAPPSDSSPSLPPLPSAPPKERSVRLTLEVSAGPSRSEVFVNGRRVGQTPFLGDLACKSSLPIHVDVVPPTGAPLRYERTCVGGTLEIEGPPP